MNRFSLILFLILFIGMSGYISGFFYLNIHEQAHVAVFNKYGIDSVTQFQYLILGGGTIPNLKQYNIRCDSVCKSDQLNIDAIGYHIALLIFSIHILIFMMLSYKIIFGDFLNNTKPKDLNTLQSIQ